MKFQLLRPFRKLFKTLHMKVKNPWCVVTRKCGTYATVSSQLLLGPVRREWRDHWKDMRFQTGKVYLATLILVMDG